MMLSVMVVGAGAAFSDQSKIKNTEAVDACTALNIIGGYPDGSFKPEGNITRAEVTKMICVALNGGKEPNLATNATPTFSDVRTNANSAWAEKYIESCYAQGIVSGVGGGKFAPAGNVTGTQLAKMLLVSLGYNPDIEKFTGNAWATNVNIIATQKGLYEGLESIDVSAALTRDNAAQMIWNALKAGEVKYEYTLVSENGQLVSKTTLENKKGTDGKDLTMLKDKYNITIVEDGEILTRVVEDDKGTYTVYTTGNDKGYTKVAKDFSDLMGQKVDILVKDYGTSNAKVFGIYADEDSAVVATGVIGDLDKASDSGKIKFNSTEYKIENSGANTRYTKVVKFNQSEEYTTTGLKALSESHAGAQQAYAIKLIDNDGNGKIDYAVVTPFTFAKVTYAGTKSVTAGSSYTFEDCDIYKDIAKDDYVAIYAKVNTVADKDTLVKAQTVSGKVGGTKGSNPITDIQVGTTWYKTAAALSINVDSSYDFAVVNGYIFASDVTAEASKDILFLSARDTLDATLSDTGTIEAKVFIGNKDQIVKIEKLEGKKITASTNTTDINSGKYADQASVRMGLYTYTVNSAGNYEIKALSDTSNKAGYDTYNSNAGKFTYATDKIGSYSIADDAVVYVQKSDNLATAKDAKCITGKQLKSWSKDYGNKLSQVLVTKTNGIEYAKVVALIDAEVPASSTSDLMYAYVVDDANNGPYVGKNSENDTVTWMTLWTGSKEIKVYTKDANTLKKGDAISYKEVSSDEIDTITKLETYVAITGVETKKEGQVVYQQAASGTTTSNSYKQDEDIVVIGIDSENSKGAELKIDGIATAQSKADGTYVPNAILAVDTSTQKVLAIFADIGNELDGKSSIDSAATSDIKAVAKEIQDKLTAPAKTGDPYTLNASSGDIVTGLTTNTMEKATVKCSVTDAGQTNIASVSYASGKLTAVADASKSLTSGTAKIKVEVSKDDGATITFDVTVTLTIS